MIGRSISHLIKVHRESNRRKNVYCILLLYDASRIIETQSLIIQRLVFYSIQGGLFFAHSLLYSHLHLLSPQNCYQLTEEVYIVGFHDFVEIGNWWKLGKMIHPV